MSDSDDDDFLEGQAKEESGDEADSEDEEEEEQGSGGEVEGLIDDGEEEEEGGGVSGEDEEEEEDETERPGKRKFDDQLEDEDYDLIAENTGIRLQRKKFRRVRQNLMDSDEEDEGGEGGGGGEAPHPPAGLHTPTEVDDLSNVFGGSDDEEELPETHVSAARTPGDDQMAVGTEDTEQVSDDEEDVDDFIVDELGKPINRRKGAGGISEPAMLEAQDIFGLDFDPAEFDQLAKEGLLSDDEDGEEVDEEMDEYGSDDDLSVTPRKSKKSKSRRSKKKTSIFDVYEPSELERGFFTERDTAIRVKDVPERFLLRGIPVEPTEDAGELEEEAEWVYQQAFCRAPVSKQPFYIADKHRSSGPQRGALGGMPPSAVPAIKEALNFMRNHSFEVPFIATYRREYVEPELNTHDLWKIWQWDEKWMQLRRRKLNMQRLFERMRDYQFEKVREAPDKALTEDTRPLTQDDFTRLDGVQTMEELSDVYAHFMLYCGRDLVAMRNSQAKKPQSHDPLDGSHDPLMDDSEEGKEKPRATVKRAQRKDFYSVCQEHGLGSLAAKFGLTPDQFGENLRDNYQRHETEQHSVEPEEEAEDYKQPNGVFNSVRAVLQGACHMVAMQIACEPLVRQTLRQVFQSRAVLNAKPTKKGRKMLDDTHPCYSMRYLRNKPVREVKGDEIFRLVGAEEERLLELRFSVDLLSHASDKRGATAHTYFEEIRQLFYRDEFSLLVEKWNAQRAQAVAHALLKVLYPLLEKELRNKLLLEAKEHVLQSCLHRFRRWLDMAPMAIKKEEEEEEEECDGPFSRVVACAYSSDRTVPAFCCCLDGSAEVVDFIRLGNLLKRKLSPFEREREEKEKDLAAFKKFLVKNRPDLIAITAESREALTVADEFALCSSELAQEGVHHVIPVEVVDPSVARIYANSRRAREAFPEYPELLRVAVSLGRRFQEPLLEFASLLASAEQEYQALHMHPLQSSLPQEQLKAGLEMELIGRVNDVGVDVNFALEHQHGADLLPFVCGLGERKAAALLKVLKQESAQLQNRSQLVTQCSIGPKVFINCAGFIRIDTTAFNDIGSYVEVLDSTRVHPETYEWARKMAVDALEYDEVGDETNPSGAVEEILVTPDKLRDLDLDAFAEELERQDYGNKRTTLYDIRDELFGPYKERRNPYVPLSLEDKFVLVSGENLESLYEGKLVTCTVVGIARRKPPQEILNRANPFQIELTKLWQCPFCLKDDFRDVSHVWQHFDDGSCPGQGIGVRTRLENGLSGFILTRNISDKTVNAPEERVHIGQTIHCRILRVNLEKFSVDLTCRSSDLLDAEGKFSASKDVYFDNELAQMDKAKDEKTQNKPTQKYVKRVIVHPSFMNATFAEAEKALAHMDQGDAIFRPSSKGDDHLTLTWKVDGRIHQHIDIKEQGKVSRFSLGRSLLIGNEEYEDLDEIIARFVQPMAANARDLLSHKCYRETDGGNVASLKRILGEEKDKNPKRIPYFFSASRKETGKFLLGYQPGRKAYHEYVTVTPEGYRYRNKTHSSVSRLIQWFKDHYREPIPRPMIPNTATSTPASIPSHITQSLDPNLYPHLEAAVNAAHHQHRGSSNTGTPYTPTQWSSSTPTPQHYGSSGGGHSAAASSSYSAQQQQQQQQQFGSYAAYQGRAGSSGGAGGGYGGPQQYVRTAGQASHYGSGGYQRVATGWSGGGGGGASHAPQQQGGWTPSLSRTPSQTPGRTPAYTPSQTPGRTPAYTPSQTPHSYMGYGMGGGGGGGGGATPGEGGTRRGVAPPGHHVRRALPSPMGTPLQDE